MPSAPKSTVKQIIKLTHNQPLPLRTSVKNKIREKCLNEQSFIKTAFLMLSLEYDECKILDEKTTPQESRISIKLFSRPKLSVYKPSAEAYELEHDIIFILARKNRDWKIKDLIIK